MGKAKIGLRAAALASVVAMTLAACGGGSDETQTSADAGADGKPVKGGTLTFLTIADQVNHIDPQRNYTGEDLALRAPTSSAA